MGLISISFEATVVMAYLAVALGTGALFAIAYLAALVDVALHGKRARPLSAWAIGALLTMEGIYTVGVGAATTMGFGAAIFGGLVVFVGAVSALGPPRGGMRVCVHGAHVVVALLGLVQTVLMIDADGATGVFYAIPLVPLLVASVRLTQRRLKESDDG